MVRFWGAREKVTAAFFEYLGVSQEATLESSLWRETLGRTLGSHDTAGLVVGMCLGSACQQEAIYFYAISCINKGGALLSPIKCFTKYWLDPLVRTKPSWSLKTHGPFERELADKTAD